MLASLILGLICVGAFPGQEAKPAAAPTAKQSDPGLQAEYDAMRAKAPNTAEGHWKVGDVVRAEGAQRSGRHGVHDRLPARSQT